MHGDGNASTITVASPLLPRAHPMVRFPCLCVRVCVTVMCTMSHLSGMGTPRFRVRVSAGNAHARTATVHHSMPERRRIVDDYSDS